MQRKSPTDDHGRASDAVSRRDCLRTSVAAGTVLVPAALASKAFAAGSDEVKVGLIGCGGRGSGAAAQAMSTGRNVKLHAMADLDLDNVNRKIELLKEQHADKVDVADERKFIGFDAYRHAIDSVRPGDVAMCTKRAYNRTLHVAYAVEKGIHVFM